MRHRRLLPGVPGLRGRHVPFRATRGAWTGQHRPAVRLPLHGGQRQRNGTDVERDPEMAGGPQGEWHYNAPGKPMQNGFVESFNGRLRDECLNEHLFANLRNTRDVIAAWREEYNNHRPHSSPDGLTPREYHQRSVEDQTLNRAN